MNLSELNTIIENLEVLAADPRYELKHGFSNFMSRLRKLKNAYLVSDKTDELHQIDALKSDSFLMGNDFLRDIVFKKLEISNA